jgi:hypothetical protein
VEEYTMLVAASGGLMDFDHGSANPASFTM